MINLLPDKQQKKIRREYYLRLLTVFCFGAAGVMFLGVLLLVPSYFASRDQADTFERFRDALEGSVGLKERDQSENAVATLNERVRLVEGYSTSGFSVNFFEALLGEIPSGISIKNISFTRGVDAMSVTVGGTADTREDLLLFIDLLRNNPAFSDVVVPVTQLVAEEDVSFSIKTTYRKL